jgi:cobalt-zinc-cadmium efflux system membrane fusion protein
MTPNATTDLTPRRGLLARLLGGVPTLFVLALLIGVAVYGHATGWKLPSPRGETGAASGDWCDAHSVPESLCVECNAALMPRAKEYGWCAVHGVPECPWEHPDVAQVVSTPTVTKTDLDRAKHALDFAPRPANSSRCKMHLRRIQFVSMDAFQKSGVDVARVTRGPVVESISANGEITYDQTRVARVSARVGGPVWRVTKRIGDRVRAGELLALVEAADVGRAKAELLQALAQAELRMKTLDGYRAASGSIPERTVREAETAAREADIRLASAEQALANLGLPIHAGTLKGLKADEAANRVRLLGIPPDNVADLDSRSAPANLLPLVAPLAGVIVAREVVAGEVVDTAKVLFIVADVERMWLTLHLRLEDARKVALKQTVRFRPDAGDETIDGKVTWIGTSVDPQTRTLKVRVDVDNRQGRLVDHAFGTGTIVLRQESEAVLVPNEAIQSDGDCQIVFVRDRNFFAPDAPKVFHTRTVRLGVRNGPNTEVIAGLLPEEVVATKGSGMLRTELLRGNLGES